MYCILFQIFMCELSSASTQGLHATPANNVLRNVVFFLEYSTNRKKQQTIN